MVKFKTDEERWMAEDDARILKRAEELKADNKRMKNAKAVLQQEFKALQKVVGASKAKTPPKKTAPKTQNKKKK